MNAIQKLEVTVTLLTVLFMYFMISKIIPQLDNLIIKLFSLQAEEGRANIIELLNLLITFLGGIGFYLIIKDIARYLLINIPVLKKFYLGLFYLEGTWIGGFTQGTETIFTVEYFEQSLNSLKIKGTGFYENGTQYAQWSSKAVSINSEDGILNYLYTCTRNNDDRTIEGVAEFIFIRNSCPLKAPYILNGFSADITDGIRTFNIEYKFSNKIIPIKNVFLYFKCLERGGSIDNQKLSQILDIHPILLGFQGLLIMLFNIFFNITLSKSINGIIFNFTPSLSRLRVSWSIQRDPSFHA